MLYAVFNGLKAYKAGAQQSRVVARAAAAAVGKAAPVDPLTNGFSRAPLELRVYISELEEFSQFDDPKALVWTQLLDLSSSSGLVAKRNITVSASDALLRNETSAWAHLYLTRAGFSPDPRSEHYFAFAAVERHHRLVAYKRVSGKKKLRSLLGADGSAALSEAPNADEGASESDNSSLLVPHWKPTLSIAVCTDVTSYPTAAAIPEVLLEHMALQHVEEEALLTELAKLASARGEGEASAPETRGRTKPVYLPRPYVSELWTADRDYLPLNGSTPQLQLQMDISLVGLLKLTLWTQLAKTLSQQAATHDTERSSAATEELRRMLTETNPLLLAVTLAVTLLHSLFDFLAFRNDIKFWRGTKSMQGLSTRALLVGVVVHAITFLYLLDNDTSNVILVSNGVGLAIEAWKVHKVCALELRWLAVCGRALLPYPRVSARGGFEHTATATYDQQAAEYVAWVLLPLVAGTSAYSVLYSRHKSWYSWLLGSLVSAVYSFGFANQAPQLFINYKLKSTAHMPWKTLCYKALNTFIDDLFAFIIKMPTMHRLSCLRDDVIFFVYMYQRYAYGVDKHRANEYGQRVEDDEVDAVAGATPAAQIEMTR